MLNCKKTILVKKWLRTILSKTFLALKPTFLRFRQNKKKIATYNIKLSTTFVLTILFSDNFFLRIRGWRNQFFAKISQRNLHPYRDVFHKTLWSTFLSGIHLSLDLCNKKHIRPVPSRDFKHYFESQFLHANIFAILANFIILTCLV